MNCTTLQPAKLRYHFSTCAILEMYHNRGLRFTQVHLLKASSLLISFSLQLLQHLHTLCEFSSSQQHYLFQHAISMDCRTGTSNVAARCFVFKPQTICRNLDSCGKFARRRTYTICCEVSILTLNDGWPFKSLTLASVKNTTS